MQAVSHFYFNFFPFLFCVCCQVCCWDPSFEFCVFVAGWRYMLFGVNGLLLLPVFFILFLFIFIFLLCFCF